MVEGAEQVDFNGLVAGLAASAIAVLSQVESLLEAPGDAGQSDSEASEGDTEKPAERRRRVSDGISGARRLIDTLAVLELKTKGNLTAEEEELLSGALAELRIRFVNLSNRAAQQGKTEGAK